MASISILNIQVQELGHLEEKREKIWHNNLSVNFLFFLAAKFTPGPGTYRSPSEFGYYETSFKPSTSMTARVGRNVLESSRKTTN